jgi:hypothetical protein
MYQHHAKNKTSNPRVAKEKESEPWYGNFRIKY